MPYTKLYIHRRWLSAILSFVTSTLFSCCSDVVCVSHIVSTTEYVYYRRLVLYMSSLERYDLSKQVNNFIEHNNKRINQ